MEQFYSTWYICIYILHTEICGSAHPFLPGKEPKRIQKSYHNSVFLSPSSPIQAPGSSRETWGVWTLTCCPTSSALPWYGHVETNYNYRLRRVLHMSEPTAECSTHLLRRAPAHDIARRTPHVLDRYVYAYVCI
jgi:hypothetical protein